MTNEELKLLQGKLAATEAELHALMTKDVLDTSGEVK